MQHFVIPDIDANNFHDMEVELQTIRNENEMFSDKIKELEKWLVLLLNNFYEGNPNSLKNIEQVCCLSDCVGANED